MPEPSPTPSPARWPLDYFGLAAMRDRLASLFDEGAGFTVIAADPLSGASNVLLAVAEQTPAVLLVDARSATDVSDLALAIADAAVSRYFPEGYGWWVGGTNSMEGAGRGGLTLMRTLRALGIDLSELREFGDSPGRTLMHALELVAEKTDRMVTIVIDHFGPFLSGLPGDEGAQLLGTLRAVSQSNRFLQFAVVEPPDGTVAAALTDAEHPLFRFGSVVRVRRATPIQIIATERGQRSDHAQFVEYLGPAAELANGVPSLTWELCENARAIRAEPRQAVLAAWLERRTVSADATTAQWDLLRAVHPLAQRATALIAAGRGPYQSPDNSKRTTDALHRMRAHGIAWQPSPRKWRIADPLLAAWARDNPPLWIKHS